jgi:hypothetical protein
MLKEFDPSSISLDGLCGSIRRSIIHNDQFKIFKILSQDRIHGLLEHGKTIVGGNNDRNLRHNKFAEGLKDSRI